MYVGYEWVPTRVLCKHLNTKRKKKVALTFSISFSLFSSLYNNVQCVCIWSIGFHLEFVLVNSMSNEPFDMILFSHSRHVFIIYLYIST